MKLRREHADDGIDDVVQREFGAEGSRFAPEMAAEESVADHGDVLTFRIVRGGFEAAAEPWRDAKEMEEIRGSPRALHSLRFRAAGEVEISLLVTGHGFELRRALLPFGEVAQRDRDAIADQCP